MPGERYTPKNPERIKSYVEARCWAKGLERADVAAIMLPDWKEPLGTWTFDLVMKAQGKPVVHDKLRKLSLALGWTASGITDIDEGREPEDAPPALSSETRRLTAEVEALATGLEQLRERVAEVLRLAGLDGPPAVGR